MSKPKVGWHIDATAITGGHDEQEVYSKLEEPDGLGGLLRLRQGGPCLKDQILAAEKAGNWPEALTLYEQASPRLAARAVLDMLQGITCLPDEWAQPPEVLHAHRALGLPPARCGCTCLLWSEQTSSEVGPGHASRCLTHVGPRAGVAPRRRGCARLEPAHRMSLHAVLQESRTGMVYCRR